jgi:hypothetical protein
MTPGLILPSQAPPQYECLCGKQFYSVRAGQRHAANCSTADEMVEQHMKEKEPKDAFTSFADPEARAWIDKRVSEGKRGTRNGRPA